MGDPPMCDALPGDGDELGAMPNFARESIMPTRKLSFSSVDVNEPPMGATIGAPERLQVFVRVRPLGEEHESAHTTVTESTVSIRTSKSTAQGRDSVEENSFSFDGVFDAGATQQQVYDAAMEPQVRSLCAGRDTLTFAYGITNAGKTYTIQGKGEGEQLGVLPRALEALFVALHQHREKAAGRPAPEASAGNAAPLELEPTSTYEVRASFLEVYGNDAFDLLAPIDAKAAAVSMKPPERERLRLKEGHGGQVYVEGLKEVELPDLKAAVQAVQTGWLARSAASNGINDVSSRSHAVLCVKLLTTKAGEEKPSATRMCVVDLAGAERQKKTQSNGARLNEANSINKDLMVLGHCLRDLRWNQSHAKGTQRMPPFRDSRITMLFRDYLSGSGQISVIAAVSPRAADAVGTLDTLRFAAIAQQVKVIEEVKKLTKPTAVPKCAGGAGAYAKPQKANAMGPPAAIARNDSETSDASDEAASAAHAEEAAGLRDQVVALQERLVAAEVERAAMERRIREEVSAEMREHIEATEAELHQRMEEERYQAEEMYHKKLALVKGATEKRVDAASVQAHTELLQQTRDIQRREAEHAGHTRRLEAELESTKAELEAARRAAPAQGDLPARVAAAEQAVREEREERGRLESRLALAEASRAEVKARAEAAEARLEAEVKAKSSLQAQINDMQQQMASVVELTRASQTGKSAKASKWPHKRKASAEGDDARMSAASSARDSKRSLEDMTNQGADEPSPKRGKSFLSRKSISEADPAIEGSGKASNKVLGKVSKLFHKKKPEPADDFTNLAAVDSMPAKAPEPTPIARRTRAGRAARAC